MPRAGSQMNVTIRKARLDELPLVQEMNHKLFLWDFARDPALNTAWPHQEVGRSYFEKKISGETGVCFVAEREGELVGYVVGRIDKEIDKTDTLLRSELENIYVEESARNSGVGKLLVNKLVAWCKGHGSENMLVTAYAGNVDAIEFYKKCGFESYALKLEKNL